jgi:hypothetical protein
MQRYLATFLIFLCASTAAAEAPISTHCLTNEFAVANAWMGTIQATDAGWKNSRTGKLLSLCADKKNEPFEKLVYRYGEPNKIEFEIVATESHKFGIFNRSTSRHTGEDLIFFSRGKYTYYVAIATGQGHGIALHVFKGNKRIFKRFSGNFDDEDFSLGPAEIDFLERKPKSRIFRRQVPPHDF